MSYLPVSVWKNPPLTYNGRNVVPTLVPSFLDGSSSFLQVKRQAIKAWMSFEFQQDSITDFGVNCP